MVDSATGACSAAVPDGRSAVATPLSRFPELFRTQSCLEAPYADRLLGEPRCEESPGDERDSFVLSANKEEDKAEPSRRAVRLGRSLSLLHAVDDAPIGAAASAAEGEASPLNAELSRTMRTISDANVGYASKLPRQASVCADVKQIVSVDALRQGEAALRDGMYLYVIMVGDTEHVRLIHEESLVFEGVLAGHSSLVERSEFVRNWTQHWEDGDAGFRHTVLYAGELVYEEGTGVLSWNNRSGHYLPDSKDHVRVALDPATFVPSDE
mmetsp:Transcript_71458/g.152716  ORF Transcript_71458/g.152716 Transcript_71458/m.152716 type:complete len:268 (+) Transcript_71458:27-830(+)